MEADWSAEVGEDLPRVSVPWEGFVDLRREPHRMNEIEECRALPVLAATLLQLNRADSGVITSKCDAWTIDPGELDPLEFEAEPASALHGFASYVDVVALDAQLFASFQNHDRWVRRAVDALRIMPMRNVRVEFVIRNADLFGREGFGLSVYVTGCGADDSVAAANWQQSLATAFPVLTAIAADVTMG